MAGVRKHWAVVVLGLAVVMEPVVVLVLRAVALRWHLTVLAAFFLLLSIESSLRGHVAAMSQLH